MAFVKGFVITTKAGGPIESGGDISQTTLHQIASILGHDVPQTDDITSIKMPFIDPTHPVEK